MTHKEFDTERLHLRPAEQEDAAFILELMNTPKWLQFIGDRKIHSLADAERYIAKRMRPQHDSLGYGNYVVIRKVDGEKIGCCGIYVREGLDAPDLGFAFLPACEGQGYGYEAAHKLLQEAKASFGINRLMAITSQDNLASQKLLEKLGFTCKGLTTLPNDDEEIMLYTFE